MKKLTARARQVMPSIKSKTNQNKTTDSFALLYFAENKEQGPTFLRKFHSRLSL